ncbi:MAG: nucleoside-diphosphate kinase [Candidatus Andersenbacteria bacterium CG10_big_fil_rev_8_21_14_0_10_54_11]|uniref:nucleoside-diphosphate kinase n=1 Tax=Candidatus Andersenbacteria bacterium CG10_big_fil_rev_8_21_14_0_10_54_11 TaxID=1974485 RepID=A0A2M6WYU6_9BACT|nr:MAG: nucleoside-diphosphate kinase [Candidatus Andersenbacteria bacterium CG10_big_fil_rev_8_21_14_0_10_54_11]
MVEQTLAIIKPDGVQRGLVGEIIGRFERAGLKIAAMKLVWPEKELVGRHYADDETYLKSVGEKALENARSKGANIRETALEIGQRVREANMRYLSSGPVLALVLEGNTAVQTVRNIIGGTNPLTADIGTIRGDLTVDDFAQADIEGRSVRNLMHASGDTAEAKREIDLWFTADHIFAYQTVMDKVLHDPSWGA